MSFIDSAPIAASSAAPSSAIIGGPACSDDRLERLAAKIRSTGMKDGVIFILEAHRPFFSLASHAAQLFGALLPSAALKDHLELLSKPENVERLITLLEAND